MKYEKYLRMDAKELYHHLISDILANPPSGESIVDELAISERYQNDFEFRAFVETGRALFYILCGEFKKAIPHTTTLIERAAALELWQLVSTNQNFLGNSYFSLGIFELALESYYNVIKTEEKHDLLLMTSLAYNNIALIYHNVEEYEKSCLYLQKAIDSLEKGGPEQPRYLSKLIHCLGDLAFALCMLNRTDEAKEALDKIQAHNLENVTPASMYIYHYGRMFYEYYSGNYEAGREEYRKCDALSNENPVQRMGLLSDYLNLNHKFELDFEFYIDGLKLADENLNSENPVFNMQVCEKLLPYYQSINDKESFDKIGEKYTEILRETHTQNLARQRQSLQIVEDYLRNKESVEDITARNTELKLVAEETLRHKNALQEAYHQIEIINELGKNMTSSLDLEKVVDVIYQNLRQNIPLHSFILMVADEETEELHSVAYYEDDILQPEFTISQHNPDSMFAECFRTGKIILSDNIQDDPRYANRKLIQVGNGDMAKSALFMPLKVGEKFIGACSIQNKAVNSYNEKDILFLEELLPYLSIALNNAIRSWTLEREIQSHLETQEELKAANSKLERLSSLDGLTQISNRRDFEFRILGLLETSHKNNMEIAVFMLDIDNFKLYNDTYGHLEGDEALKSVAHIVRENLDTVDGLSARFGGEEFIGACTGLSMEEVEALGEQIRSDVFEMGIENKLAPLGQLSVSVGIAFSQSLDVSHKSSIMRWADICLYQAKNTGKNKVVLKQIEPDDEPPGRLEVELNMKK
ncbi:MAG: GGDEF domain-containing protein [Peptostreptococcaceae bacterium]|nr:GGDEF domain-containing protein [Peptostreptococcaceae bacterium]